VLCFHGSPGARYEHHPDESIARSLCARVIVPDRPGYGLSDFLPGRRLLDWPEDVAQLADALRLGSFALVGYSGGGPYAAACAFKLPERLTRVALVASPAPPARPGMLAGMEPLNRLTFALGRLPWPAQRPLYALGASYVRRDPLRAVRRIVPLLPPEDRAVLARPEVKQVFVEAAAEAFRQGGRGAAWDDRLCARPWGFALDALTTATSLWQGERDSMVTPAMGRYLARTIPNCRANFLPDAGHLVFYTHWERILSDVLA
jgi:pimeloyl-ACP methyl ester carboxylesterase